MEEHVLQGSREETDLFIVFHNLVDGVGKRYMSITRL